MTELADLRPARIPAHHRPGGARPSPVPARARRDLPRPRLARRALGGDGIHRRPLDHAGARRHRCAAAADAADRVPDPATIVATGLENLAGAPSATAAPLGRRTVRSSPACSGWCTAPASPTTCRSLFADRSSFRCSASISGSRWASSSCSRWPAWRSPRSTGLARTGSARPSVTAARAGRLAAVVIVAAQHGRGSGGHGDGRPVRSRCWRSRRRARAPDAHLGDRARTRARPARRRVPIRVFADDFARSARRPGRRRLGAGALSPAPLHARRPRRPPDPLAWEGASAAGDALAAPPSRRRAGGPCRGAGRATCSCTSGSRDQVNIVRATYGGRATTLLFTRGEASKALP